MITNTYRIADKNISVSSCFNQVHILCREYLYDGKPDFVITVDNNDINFEREKFENTNSETDAKYFSDSYLETLAVYRKIAEQMIDYSTWLFHGSVVAVDGNAFLFAADSGTGKSTHTALWRKYFGNRAVMVNDDKPLLKIGRDGVFACGTPWNGKHNLGNNIILPLKAICFIHRSVENNIEALNRKQAFHLILKYAYRSSDKDRTAKSIMLADRILTNVLVYSLGCNMDLSAVLTAYNRITEDFK